MRSLFVALFAVALAVTGACTQSDDVSTIEAIDNAADAASTFADDLRSLGRPDVPSGD